MSALRPLFFAGAASALYALLAADWKHPSIVLMLLVLFAILEMFPMRAGKISLTFGFPVLYAMTLMTGFSATALLAFLVVIGAGLVRKRPLRNVMLHGLHTLVALTGSGLAVRLYLSLDWLEISMLYYVVKITVATVVYTMISNTVVFWYSCYVLGTKSTRPTLVKLTVLNFVVSYCYLVLMLFLANDPRTSASGHLGVLFFFLPLLALAIVTCLFANLTRTKSGLETLFEVSQSINEQIDLQSVLTQVVCEANNLVRGHCGLLFLVQEDGYLKAMVGSNPALEVRRLAMGQGLAGHAAAIGQAVLVPDCTLDARLLPGETDPTCRALLLLPIHIDSQAVGVLSLAKKEPHSITDFDLKMMSIFATHAAIAMKNAMYIEEREKRLVLEERNRLAREMHDGLAQDLASAILQLEMLRRQPTAAEVQNGLSELQENLRRTTTAVRQSIYSLRPEPYKKVGLVPALRAHLDEVEAQHDLRTKLELNLSSEEVSPCVARTVYSIVTEAIQNAVKHARARELVVTLSIDAELLALSVRDDGRGFHFGQMILAAAERRSFGIENLYTLADQIGGTLDISTAPGQGTDVILEIPLKEKKEETAHDHSRVAL